MVSKRRGSKKSMKRGSRKSMKRKSMKRKSSKKKSSTRKRPMNQYFKLMLAAKKKELPSFVYNGKTYVRTLVKKGNFAGRAVYKAK